MNLVVLINLIRFLHNNFKKIARFIVVKRQGIKMPQNLFSFLEKVKTLSKFRHTLGEIYIYICMVQIKDVHMQQSYLLLNYFGNNLKWIHLWNKTTNFSWHNLFCFTVFLMQKKEYAWLVFSWFSFVFVELKRIYK